MSFSDFFTSVNRLKGVKRSGWVERGVEEPESVADHSFMTALFCMVLPAEGVDREKAIRMALVHDLAESEVGDIITKESWKDGGAMPRAEKVALERDGLKKLLKGLDKGTAREISGLWEEYEKGKTPEAVFVRDADIAEMILQAVSYHAKGNYRDSLGGFWEKGNTERINNESIKIMVENIIRKADKQ
ncbi:MAG: phosphohydrolase [Candidatus Aenigmatarchaeota archaeon]|nr:MAG: phosphohydrolase [Candidatus Aenigmarchaeota archaeon]